MTIFENRDAAFSKFTEAITCYGLKARKTTTTRYFNDNYSVVTFCTEHLTVKGNKQLIEQLELDGFLIYKFCSTDPSTFRRSMRFQAEKSYFIPRQK